MKIKAKLIKQESNKIEDLSIEISIQEIAKVIQLIDSFEVKTGKFKKHIIKKVLEEDKFDRMK